MPVQYSAAEITGELQKFMASYEAGKPVGEMKVAVDKITDDILALHAKYEQIEKRADAIEIKQNQKRTYSVGDPLKDQLEWALSRGANHPVPGKTIGQIDRKDITGVSAAMPVRYEPIVPLGRPEVGGVRRLIGSSRTAGGSIDYLEETSYTNNAAAVAEGAIKPRSDKTFTARNITPQVVAHLFKISQQCYEDLPTLVALVEENGIWGVEDKIEQMLLHGTGTAPVLQGIYPLATAVAGPPPAGTTTVDLWFQAISELGRAGYRVNGIVASWELWTSAQLMKDGEGRYLWGSGPALPPIVPSRHLAAAEWIVGDFVRGAHIFEVGGVSVLVASMNVDDFERNYLTIRVEERLGHAVWRPQAFRKNGPLTATAASGPEVRRTK